MSTAQTAQPAKVRATSTGVSLAGHNGSLNGQCFAEAQPSRAVEGSASPQAITITSPNDGSPAGNGTAQPAIRETTTRDISLAGHQAGRDQERDDTHPSVIPAAGIPGHTLCDTQVLAAGGDGQPAATRSAASTDDPLLADPLLALAADVLSDLEKVRIANENRLRQLTRSAEDKDGETRGFGLDESHPDVARLAALVGMLAEAEHKATLNLGRLMRAHPLGPWMRSMKGVGEKQGARLLAAIGDPYIRPEIVREDGIVEPSRPRLVSELWALCGYHVIPVSGHPPHDAHIGVAADGSNGSHPSQGTVDTHSVNAGVAPKRARGQKANWSGAAKMRAYLVAESCIKQMDGQYRKVYDATREKYADAVHATECVRCGPRGKPAQPGSALSDGHKHARALRAVAKEVLRDLWREAKRLHEQAPVSGQSSLGTQPLCATDGLGGAA